MDKKIGIGFVGVGNISDTYLNNITNLFEDIYIAGVCGGDWLVDGCAVSVGTDEGIMSLSLTRGKHEISFSKA